jgi:hypothetical protein
MVIPKRSVPQLNWQCICPTASHFRLNIEQNATKSTKGGLVVEAKKYMRNDDNLQNICIWVPTSSKY